MNNSDKTNAFTFEIVAEMLNGFQDMKRKAMQLEFEINKLNSLVSDSDIINSMTFGSAEGDKIKGGYTSDKTANIAISYSTKLDNIRIKETKDLSREYMSVTLLMERLKHYISFLDPKYACVLQKLYLEDMSFTEVAESIGVSLDTVKNYRRAGIRKLVDMFNYIVE